MPRFTFADGRPNVAVPPRREAVRAGPPSSFAAAFERLRAGGVPHPHVVCAVSAGPTRPCAVSAGPSRSRVVRAGPPLPRRRPMRMRMPPPTSSRRRRERRSATPHVTGGGRDGNNERDDGSGSDGDSGSDHYQR
jgi:hypothetical protein